LGFGAIRPDAVGKPANASLAPRLIPWEIDATVVFLAEHPLAARESAELAPPARIHPYRAHVIVYQLDGADILILRLRHGREDELPSPAGP